MVNCMLNAVYGQGLQCLPVVHSFSQFYTHKQVKWACLNFGTSMIRRSQLQIRGVFGYRYIFFLFLHKNMRTH